MVAVLPRKAFEKHIEIKPTAFSLGQTVEFRGIQPLSCGTEKAVDKSLGEGDLRIMTKSSSGRYAESQDAGVCGIPALRKERAKLAHPAAALIAVFVFFISSGLFAQQLLSGRLDNFAGHPRAFIVSDIGNEPDDQMSFVRVLLYSNEIDLEGLVAATSTWQKTATHPETMHEIIAKYGEVRPNLLKHAPGWPTAADLDRLVSIGQPAYGMAAVGSGKSHQGRRRWSMPPTAKTPGRYG